MNQATPQQEGIFAAGVRPETDNTEFNALSFFIQSMMQAINVATLVKVVSAPEDFGVEPASTVDVVPLVSMVDGSGQVWDHTTVYSLPFFRLQGGAQAIIIDPEIGDIGLAVFCDRDTTAVRATSKQAGPPTQRRFSMSDGFYFGAWVSTVAPTAWLRMVGRQFAAKASSFTFYEGDINIADGVLKVAGTQVVSVQQSPIPYPTGGSVVDVEARTAVISCISRMQSHGLISL